MREKMKSSDKGQRSFSIILLDLGNVLVRVDYPAFFRTLGFDHEMSERELYELLEEDSRALETGKVTTEEYLVVINTKLQTSYTFNQFRRAWNAILPEVIPAMSELVERLASKYRLMVLSNTNELHFPHMIEMLPVSRHFERCFLSFEIGALKPDPAIYRSVLSHIDVPADQMLFIDDVKENIHAARNAGMSGIVFRGVGALLEELEIMKVI